MINLPGELKNAYRVKLTVTTMGDTLFGILEKYGEEAEALWTEGKIIIEDAVTGNRYAFPFKDCQIVPQPLTICGEHDPETNYPITAEYDRYVNDAFKKAIETHVAAGEGVRKGKLCSVPVADGHAYYEITRVNKKTCRVEWRGFGLDRYVDRRWGYQSTVPLEDADMYLCQWLERKIS